MYSVQNTVKIHLKYSSFNELANTGTCPYMYLKSSCTLLLSTAQHQYYRAGSL